MGVVATAGEKGGASSPCDARSHGAPTDAPHDAPTARDLAPFREKVLARGRELYRDLPWRRTRDPYEIWMSEVMLQQTQVVRVDGRWQRWLERFPTIEALAGAPTADVLDEWQGLGYNRRALGVHRAAQQVMATSGELPRDLDGLVALPGIGPATAAGIIAFAHDRHAVYLETNVRSVMLHELFASREGVPDRELAPIVAATCPPDASDPSDDPRTWYYALLDYGAYLKRTLPNPGRRSGGHVRQSRFEGSHRQKRAALLRLVLARGAAGASAAELAAELDAQERAAGRDPVGLQGVEALLDELSHEGFCHGEKGFWRA